MTADEFLREIAQALTRQEDLTTPEAKEVLYELALRIYALLLQALPEGRMERYLAWPTLRAQLLTELESAAQRLGETLYSRLTAAERMVQAPVAQLYELPADALSPRPVTELLDTTVVLGAPISRLFTPDPLRGASPFALQLLRLLERSLLPLFFQEQATQVAAERVIGTRTRAGVVTPVPRRGTVANAWVERYRAIVAAALWSVVTPAQLRAVSALALRGAAAPVGWRWSAILDPRTCPICRPLDGAIAPTPDAFPRGAPPLHPLCRCIVIPVGKLGL